jgi:secretion/DNA translocation related TadE-like protein
MTTPAGTNPAPRGATDSGIATVWAAIAVAALVAVLAAMLGLVAAVGGRHRAEAAADLAALAAAVQAVRGETVACGRAGQVATGTGGRLVLCRVRGGVAEVEVEVALRIALLGGVTARSRARAGPADPPLMPPSTPLGDTRVIPDSAFRNLPSTQRRMLAPISVSFTPSGRRQRSSGQRRETRRPRGRDDHLQ